jgi:hypothetical protein
MAVRRALLAAIAVGVGAQQQLPECRHTFPDGNTFDLSGLRKPPMYLPNLYIYYSGSSSINLLLAQQPHISHFPTVIASTSSVLLCGATECVNTCACFSQYRHERCGGVIFAVLFAVVLRVTAPQGICASAHACTHRAVCADVDICARACARGGYS